MITLIGGSGFIGTRISSHFSKTNRPFIIIDKVISDVFPEKTRKADIRSVEDFIDKVPEESVIMNLAAVHRDDVRPKRLYDETNVEGARNVCSVAREKNCNTIIFTSSVAVYGFAPPGTDETGAIHYFNDYGRTKWEAEKIYRAWQAEDPDNRTLVIVRPTVVFGEQNRGNVYNLLNQIATGRFYMVGNGTNKKSMAYVENVAAFLEYSIDAFETGVHLYNYVDKPDFDMQSLVSKVREYLGIEVKNRIHIPYFLGYLAGMFYDGLSLITGRTLPVSRIRIKKFCATTQFDTSLSETSFTPPVSMVEGLENTLKYEFLEDNSDKKIFYTE